MKISIRSHTICIVIAIDKWYGIIELYMYHSLGILDGMTVCEVWYNDIHLYLFTDAISLKLLTRELFEVLVMFSYWLQIIPDCEA